jgi:hypothetical protein
VIFKPELVEKILAGEKTETRRPVKYDADGRVVPCRYTVGKDYAVQPGRTKPGIPGLRLKVLSVVREHLGQMDHRKALLEGFSGTDEFFRYWERLHGRAVPDLQAVWAIRFELVETSADEFSVSSVRPKQVHGTPGDGYQANMERAGLSGSLGSPICSRRSARWTKSS